MTDMPVPARSWETIKVCIEEEKQVQAIFTLLCQLFAQRFALCLCGFVRCILSSDMINDIGTKALRFCIPVFKPCASAPA